VAEETRVEAMSLANRLAVTPPHQSWSRKAAHPKGWEPGVTFDPDTHVPTELITPVVPKITGDDYQGVLDSMGIDLPEGYELRLVAASYDPAAWHRDEAYGADGKKTPAVTRPSWRYRFQVVKT